MIFFEYTDYQRQISPHDQKSASARASNRDLSALRQREQQGEIVGIVTNQRTY